MPTLQDLQKAINRLIKNVLISEASLDFLYATDPFLEGIKSGGYGELIGFLQEVLYDRMFLSTAKLYDSDSRSHSIQRTITMLEDGSHIWPIKNRDLLLKCLRARGFKPKVSMLKGSDNQITMEVVNFCILQLPTKNGTDRLSLAFQNVQERRNKRIAHDDWSPTNGAKRASKDDFHCLLGFAKMFISAIGAAYLEYPIVDAEGNYTPSDEKVWPSLQLQKLLKKAGVSKSARR